MSTPKNYTAKVRLDPINKNEDTKAIKVENFNDVRFICEPPSPLGRTPTNYITGPIADRLYDFESLGYEPAELERIIRLYRAYRIIAHSTFGSCASEKKDISKDFNIQLLLYEALKNPDKSIHISVEDGSPCILITPWPKGEAEE